MSGYGIAGEAHIGTVGVERLGRRVFGREHGGGGVCDHMIVSDRILSARSVHDGRERPRVSKRLSVSSGGRCVYDVGRTRL